MATRIEQFYDNNNKVYPQEKEWELIWTNPNPTEQMGETTIDVDISQYSQLKILAENQINLNGNYIENIMTIPSIALTFSSNGSSAYIEARRVVVNKDSIVFSRGVRVYDNSISDIRAVPYKIYAR